jgi:hypothetical protein
MIPFLIYDYFLKTTTSKFLNTTSIAVFVLDEFQILNSHLYLSYLQKYILSIIEFLNDILNYFYYKNKNNIKWIHKVTNTKIILEI